MISPDSFEFVPNVPANGNPPVADDADVFGYTCIAGADQTCADVTSFDFATDGVDLASFDGTTPVTIGALTPNTDYTCFGLVDNVCTGSPTDDFVCGTPFALQTPVTNANTLTTVTGVEFIQTSLGGTDTFDLDFIVNVGGGAVPLADMTFAVGCVDGGNPAIPPDGPWSLDSSPVDASHSRGNSYHWPMHCYREPCGQRSLWLRMRGNYREWLESSYRWQHILLLYLHWRGMRGHLLRRQ